MSGAALVPADLGVGLVPIGFAERMLDRARELDDPRMLWDGATTLGALAQKWNGHGREKREIKAAQMFLEIQLGQVLGPNPGDDGKGSWADGESPHADTGIPRQRINELRRMYGHAPALIEEVRNGKVSRRSLLLIVDRQGAAERAWPRTAELDIRRGDFRDVLTDVTPGSVALVLTDPPYVIDDIAAWHALADWAAEALAEGGSLVAYCSQDALPDAAAALASRLRYWWTFCFGLRERPGVPAIQLDDDIDVASRRAASSWRPLLWFVRERRANNAVVADSITMAGRLFDVATSTRNAHALESIVSALTAPGDLIVDPFAGSGGIGLLARRFGRRFIGAELGSIGRQPSRPAIPGALASQIVATIDDYLAEHPSMSWDAVHDEVLAVLARVEHQAERVAYRQRLRAAP